MISKHIIRGGKYLDNQNKVSSGVKGLDVILKGGYLKNRTYLLKGGPGTGKTTLGLHFLEEGINNNESCMFINLEESKKELINDAKNFNFQIEEVAILDLTPGGAYFKEEKNYDVFSPSEVEQLPLIEKIRQEIENINPDRLVFDGLSQLYFLYENKFNLRKSIISLIQYLAEKNSTSLFITENSSGVDNIMEYITSGVINLDFDGYERKLNVLKFRGSDHLKDFHSLTINEDGINILPNLLYKKRTKDLKSKLISSGIEEVDKLLSGGIESNTNTIIIGPTGVGKTTLSTSFIRESVTKGNKAILYLFEEANEVLVSRCKSINMSLDQMIKEDKLIIKNVNSLECNPIEFSNIVREDVNNYNIDLVMLDSITGYYLSFASEYYSKIDLLKHLHNLSNYLTNYGITVFMTNEMENITGDFKSSELGISYLADNIIFLRYIELNSQLNKIIGVLKKRLSGFEKTIREFEITSEGIKVGEPLTNIKGILTNNIEFM